MAEDRKREPAVPPWRGRDEGIGAELLFLVLTFLILVVGVLLYFGMGVLFG